MHRHAMCRQDIGGERRSGQIPLLTDPAGNPVLKGRQLAMPAAIALRLRRKATGGGLKLDHVVDEFDRNLEPRRRRPVRIPLRHMFHDPPAQLYRMRPTHQMSPISASRKGNHNPAPKGIPNPIKHDML